MSGRVRPSVFCVLVRRGWLAVRPGSLPPSKWALSRTLTSCCAHGEIKEAPQKRNGRNGSVCSALCGSLPLRSSFRFPVAIVFVRC